MKKRVDESKITEIERDLRELALADHRAKRKPKYNRAKDEEIAKPYAHLTRHQLSQLVTRERMRWEAEQVRKNKERAWDAKTAHLNAKAALAARDRMAANS